MAGSMCVLSAATAVAATPLQQRAEAFVQPRLLMMELKDADATASKAILERPDPGTFFLRYAFGLQRHAKKLLSATQAGQLAAVIEKHSPGHNRWHDERNTLRCKFNEVLWRYAAASNAEAPVLRAELDGWMRLRMLWTRQEHLAQYRFARDVWQVLTAEQQRQVIAGEWKDYAAQDTGHTRADATAKVLVRALGKPDDKAAFDAAVTEWSRQREPLHAAVSESENHERRIVFAMDLNSEALANQACLTATEAYARLYLAEADALRRIVHAAYTKPAARGNDAATKAWQEATERFGKGAAELIALLGSGAPR